MTLKKICFIALCAIPSFCLAKQFGEVYLSIGDGTPKRIIYEVKGEKAITEGDIMLGKVLALRRQGAVAIKYPNMRWPDAIIPFEFDRKLPTTIKLNVLLAFEHYQRLTSIRFVERTKKNKEKYVNYIHFISDATACWSYVGMNGGAQEINLSVFCDYGGVIHEIGHALGLMHEQNRIDRNHYVRINYENIDPDQSYNFDQGLSYSVDIGDYDYDSVMHYGAYYFSRNGKKTITVLDGKHSIGQRGGLSKDDIAALKVMYPQ
jgi:hypothetical protein